MIDVKAKPVGRVEFVIDLDKKPDKIRFLWKKGKLYLSIRGVLLNTDSKWYEISVENIKDITIDETGLLTVDFGAGVLRLTSKDMNSLRAFRHFILPYVGKE